MRQSLRYDKLQQEFELLQRLGLKLDDTEAQLAALHPLLRNDEQTQKQKRADAEQQLIQRRGELVQLEDYFNQQSRELNDQLSKTQSELKTVQSWLDYVQKKTIVMNVKISAFADAHGRITSVARGAFSAK